MRKGIPHIPLPNPRPGRQMIGKDESFEGVRLVYDPKCSCIAQQKGFWPTSYIAVGPRWFELDEDEQNGVLYHELHHVQSRHNEIRWLMVFFFWVPSWQRKIHKQELSADAFAVSKGYGVALLRAIKRIRPDGPFYPAFDYRCAHLVKRIKEQDDVKAVWAA
jgi:hypothetical protein